MEPDLELSQSQGRFLVLQEQGWDKLELEWKHALGALWTGLGMEPERAWEAAPGAEPGPEEAGGPALARSGVSQMAWSRRVNTTAMACMNSSKLSRRQSKTLPKRR